MRPRQCGPIYGCRKVIIQYIFISRKCIINTFNVAFMIKTAADIINGFPRIYREPYHHLSFLERTGEIFQLKRGLYETDSKADPLALAASIAGPSYLSFETALSYYGLIPERTLTYLSASYLFRKRKAFSNHFGTFVYLDVPAKAYPLGTRFFEIGGRKVEIATPEKALCDILCKAVTMKTVEELKEWLYSFMRMDEEDILALDRTAIESWTLLYGKKNVSLLVAYLKGGRKDE